jgi:Ca2+-binding RTX toxin-like protein
MSRLGPVLAAAVALLARAAAAADNVVTLKNGEARFYSDDPGLASNYVVKQVGSNISFFDDVDPQGTQNYPFEICRAGRTDGTRVIEILCPKSSIKSIVMEPGPGEDKAQYTVPDLPAALAGATGADALTSTDSADDLSGEQGNDVLTSGGGDDILNGDEGNDSLDSGAGNDKLTGATGTDGFAAGAGDDAIVAADGLAEKVDCGDGNDTVTADAQDTLTGCENTTTQNVTAPTEEPTGDDKTKPKLEIGGSSSQRLGKSVRFVATCSEKGLVQAIGYVQAGGVKEVFKLVERKVTVGGGGVVVKLPFSKRQRGNAARDLRRKRTPRVRVTISCVDQAGNTSRARRFWIALRR